MESRKKVLWKLFFSTLYLSAFTFGGGYVIITLMKKRFVDGYRWIEEEEMLDLVAIAQSAPGMIIYPLLKINSLSTFFVKSCKNFTEPLHKCSVSVPIAVRMWYTILQRMAVCLSNRASDRRLSRYRKQID